MISFGQAFHELRTQLKDLYDEGEASAIATMFIDHITQTTYLQRLSYSETVLPEELEEKYRLGKNKLLQGRPIQYVIGYAWFMDKKFYVDENVLIPRPETEELVQWIIDEWQDWDNVSILDIGTGSGCIPVSLKLALKNAVVTSCDISSGALEVAQSNARALQADVLFLSIDFLDRTQWTQFSRYDIIVSNPPYIPLAESATLHKNVLDHEPAAALFVPDNDALLFYKAIAIFGKEHLKVNGAIYCELHRDYAVATQKMFLDNGYANVVLKKDMHGNDRMLKASI